MVVAFKVYVRNIVIRVLAFYGLNWRVGLDSDTLNYHPVMGLKY